MSMTLPKVSEKTGKRRIWKICKELGCGKEYFGHPISKYCEFHMDPSKRVRLRKKFEDPSVKNNVFNHRFNDVVNLEFSCQLDGCLNKFKVKVYPKVYVYPKFCECHRNEFQRKYFKKKAA